MRVAIIPARGGSKRIPRKNIRDFCGKPMIAWSIDAALACKSIDEVIVSTDDVEIADIARSLGASVPFIRPTVLSDDHTGTLAVIRHAIGELEVGGPLLESVCCLYATAPFVSCQDLESGFNTLMGSGADFAFSVAAYPYPIQRALRVSEAGRISMFDDTKVEVRSQDLEPAYHDAGQFYWGRRSAWIAGLQILGTSSVPIVLPSHRVQDVDTLEDWIRAEWLFRAMRAESEGDQPTRTVDL